MNGDKFSYKRKKRIFLQVLASIYMKITSHLKFAIKFALNLLDWLIVLSSVQIIVVLN